MPYTTVVAGTTITAAWSNANVRDQVITPFADSAARSAAITSPVEGMVSFLTGNNRLDVYNGSSWSALLNPAAGAWVSWNSFTVTQNGSNFMTLSGNAGSYFRVGRHVRFKWYTSFSAATGTFGPVRVLLPFAAVGGAASGAEFGGAGYVIFTAPGYYAQGLTYTTAADPAYVYYALAGANVASPAIGTVAPTNGYALVVGDVVYGSVDYEAAADA